MLFDNCVITVPQYEAWFVKCFGWFENASAIFIAMEYFPLGDLHTHLCRNSKLSVGDCQKITHQILEGIRFMHKADFAHRDIKPGVSNLQLEHGRHGLT